MADPREPVRVDPQALLASLLIVRDSQLGEALAALEGAREAMAAAREAVEAARDEVHLAVRRLGAAYVAAQDQPPVELLRELYWDHPEVRVDQLAAAFGFRQVGEVAALVGPDERPLPCRGGCGRSIVRRRVNRTDTTYRRGSADPRLCDACRHRSAQREQEARAGREAIYARHDAEDAELLREVERAVEAGAEPAAVYVEYPGVPGTWRLLPDGTRERAL